MCTLSDTAGSISFSQTSGEVGSFTAPLAGENSSKELIDRANSVPIIHIFKKYGVHLNAYRHRTTCPFKSHRTGGDKFNYYPETNTYFCFGCSKGSKPCDFVADMDGCSKPAAARKILDLFGDSINENDICSGESFSERLKIMLDFSDTIREFRQTHLNEKMQKIIEIACEVYDQHNLKRDLGNDALRRISELIKERLVYEATL